MYVTELRYDHWADGRDLGEAVPYPTIDQVDLALRQLDGRMRTMVTLAADDGSFLGIGGGNDGNYVVSATLQDNEIWTIVRPDQGDREEEVRIVTGGQVANYPKPMCVDLNTALRAARTFAQDGTLDSALPWKQE